MNTFEITVMRTAPFSVGDMIEIDGSMVKIIGCREASFTVRRTRWYERAWFRVCVAASSAWRFLRRFQRWGIK